MNESIVYPAVQLCDLYVCVSLAEHHISSVLAPLSTVTIHLPTLQDQGIENPYILTIRVNL